MNRHALRLTQRLGFAYASDCRGKFPFIPVIDGELVHCPQLPTTLPTFDELLLPAPLLWIRPSSGFSKSRPAIGGDHVFTLRAELEGMKFSDAFERLLVEWKAAGLSTGCLARPAGGSRNIATLPRHTVALPRSRVERATHAAGARLPRGLNEKGGRSRPFACETSVTDQSRSPLKTISRLSRLTKTL
jgi:hypothetical protein